MKKNVTIVDAMSYIVNAVERMTPEAYAVYIAVLKASYEAKMKAHGIQE